MESWDECEKQIHMPVEKNYFTYEDDMKILNKNMENKKVNKFSYLSEDDEKRTTQRFK